MLPIFILFTLIPSHSRLIFFSFLWAYESLVIKGIVALLFLLFYTYLLLRFRLLLRFLSIVTSQLYKGVFDIYDVFFTIWIIVYLVLLCRRFFSSSTKYMYTDLFITGVLCTINLKKHKVFPVLLFEVKLYCILLRYQ